MPEFSSFDGTRIAYRDDGKGHPVLLLHGYMSSAEGNFGPWSVTRDIFSRAMSVMSEGKASENKTPAIRLPDAPAETAPGLMARLRKIGARVIAPDMRGHGASDKPTDARDYLDYAMARDAVALLDYLDVEDVDVMGYSMGAANVLKLLSLRDKRVRSAILAGMGPGLSITGRFIPDYSHAGDAYPPEIKRPLTAQTMMSYCADVLLGKQPAMGIAGSQAAFIDALGLSRSVAAAICVGMGETTPPEALKDVGIPVLVLNGDDDLQKLDEKGFADVLANVRFGSARGDHVSALVDPDFQREVSEFLQWRWHRGNRSDSSSPD